MYRFLLLVSLALLVAGCSGEDDSADVKDKNGRYASPHIEGKKVNVGRNVWIEVMPDKSRRVLIAAEVCLRQGMLEMVLTRKGKKQHEAIFAADIDARKAHEALLLAGAKPGKPVEYEPEFVLAKGSRVHVDVLYSDENGKRQLVPAGNWVKESRTGKGLDTVWVFAGSRLVSDSDNSNGPKAYLANEGDIITLVNMDTALLDVPFKSSKSDDDRVFEAWEERIPPTGTKVYLVLTPVRK